MRIVFLILSTISLIASSALLFLMPRVINKEILVPLESMQKMGVPSSELPTSAGLWTFISYFMYALGLGVIFYVVQVYRKKSSTILGAVLIVIGLILSFMLNQQLATERSPIETFVIVALPLVLTVVFGFIAQKTAKSKIA